MKKIIYITIVSFMVLGMSSISMATTASGADGQIVIGTLTINLTNKGVSRYDSEAGAGSLGAAANQGWAVTTGSTAGNDNIALEFFMQGSQGLEDNNLYQRLLGAIPTAATSLTDPNGLDPTAAGWSIRGGN